VPEQVDAEAPQAHLVALAAGHPATYAERLRGRRFSLPVAACVVALAVSGFVWQSHITPPIKPAPPSALAKVDPALSSVLHRLQAQQVFCGDLHATTPTDVTCRLGAIATPVTIRSFPTHRVVVTQLRTFEHAAHASFAHTHAVTFLVSGRQWVISGIWSSNGQYEAAGTPAAETAQLVSRALNGCLELLPREAGSCSF
jgi:hypothetical protein